MNNAPGLYTGGQAPATDGDNRYKSVQHKLTTLARTLDSAALELEQLQLRMKTNGGRSEDAAGAIANAGLDPVFVQMQNAVSLALGGAEVSARKVNESAHEVASLAHDAQATHARLYQGLDDIRSSRRYQTPRPGFFTR
ncbi:conjugal transfer protein TraB [Streptomyces sp. NPDC017991]|uniref:conjugal transfer protein TraB n=1 Tax=Streptomyces sp. NPDC017991 TaxID=3365026 RepID=UPI003796C46E